VIQSQRTTESHHCEGYKVRGIQRHVTEWIHSQKNQSHVTEKDTKSEEYRVTSLRDEQSQRNTESHHCEGYKVRGIQRHVTER